MQRVGNSLRNNPEERSSQLLRGESLKSRIADISLCKCTSILAVSSVFVEVSSHCGHDRAPDAGWGLVTDPQSREKCANNEATDH